MIVQGLSSESINGTIGRGYYKRDAAGQLWKLIVDSDTSDPLLNAEVAALYNLSLDPGESTDLKADSSAAALLAEMTAEYFELIVAESTAH